MSVSRLTFSISRRLLCTIRPTENSFCGQNPYKKKHEKCVICQYNIPVDYKNVQLLSQFVSPHTGRVYDNKVTGLCIPMHQHITKMIKTARDFGFMPWDIKEPVFLQDPKLFNPMKRK